MLPTADSLGKKSKSDAMPKVNLIRDPPIDMLKAVILERKDAKKWTFKDLSIHTGYSEVSLRRMFQKRPWDWTPQARKKICKALGVPEQILKDTAGY